MNEIGRKLQEARILKNWSVETLHERTKIAVHIIEMIETGERGELPEMIYRGFVKTLCDELELDSKTVLGVSTKHEPPSEKKHEENDSPGFSLSAIGVWLGARQRYMIFGLIAGLICTLAYFYIKYGKTLFAEPPYEPLVQTTASADSLQALKLPFELTLIPSKEMRLEIAIDSSGGMFKSLKTGEEVTWEAEQCIALGVNDPADISLFIGTDSLVWQTADSGFGTDFYIDALGVQTAKARQQFLAEPVQVAAAPPKPEPQMWIGHITEPTLYLDFPGYLNSKRSYSPDPSVIRQIQERNPSYSAIAFFQTFDTETQPFIAHMLKVLEAVRSDGLSLTLIGVDKRNKDKAGLTDFYQVHEVPIFVFLFKGKEVGRMTRDSGQSPEQWLLHLVQTSG